MKQKTFPAGIFILLLGFLVGFFIFPAEAQEEAEQVFAPFVSHLEAEVRNNFIRLSWKDARDIRGPVYVYRSDAPLSLLSAASLPIPAEVAYGAESYLDEADRPGAIHYFIAASDEWGRKYLLSIPYTNTITISINPEDVPGYAFPFRPSTGAGNSGESPVVPEAGRPDTEISAFNAQVEENRVVIRFSGGDSRKNLLLYRSISPIRNQGDLLHAAIIRHQAGSPVIDYPAPGIPYYYALVYEEDLSAGIAALRPGGNASTGPVEIPDSSRAVPSRTMPLPRLNISGSEASAPEPEPARNRDRAASSPERRGRTMEAAVFPEDLQSGAAGEDYQLRSIVQGYFSLHEWDRAEEELKRFLALPRKGQNQAKARFYLGQIYYFRGNSREALFEFLEAREKYPVEANPWIQAVLDSFTR